MDDLQRILIIGAGGREAALAWKLGLIPGRTIYGAMGFGAGIIPVTNVNFDVKNHDSIAKVVREHDIQLSVVGPEAPLCAGLADYFFRTGLVADGHRIFGPESEAAKLEGSKVWAKKVMKGLGIPTAESESFGDYDAAVAYVRKQGAPIVVKADGLAAGKGAIVCMKLDDAVKALDSMMRKKEFGKAGEQVVIEQYLDGEEASILALVDGVNYVLLPSSQDHKRVFDGDQGPNTGGMGAYSPAPVFTKDVEGKVRERILDRLIPYMAEQRMHYRGCLYVGIMVVKGDPYVIEFNCRFGDPETQAVLPRIKDVPGNDLGTLLMASATGTLDQHQVHVEDNAACCVVMTSGGYPGDYKTGKMIYQGLDGFCRADQIPGVYLFPAGLERRMGHSNGICYTTGGRVIGVTGVGADIRAAIDKAYDGVNCIAFKNAHYRTDIGARALNR